MMLKEEEDEDGLVHTYNSLKSEIISFNFAIFPVKCGFTSFLYGRIHSKNDPIYTMDYQTSKAWPEGQMASYQKTSL